MIYSLLFFLLLIPSCLLHSRHSGFLASLNTQVPSFFVTFKHIVPFEWNTLLSDIECPVPSLPSGYYLNATLSEKPCITSNNTPCFSQFLHPGLFYFIASILVWQIFSHVFIISLSSIECIFPVAFIVMEKNRYSIKMYWINMNEGMNEISKSYCEIISMTVVCKQQCMDGCFFSSFSGSFFFLNMVLYPSRCSSLWHLA